MPALSVGFVPDSSELGFRGGLEDMALALFTRLGRPDIMTGLGTLEGGQAVSLPKMLLDAEVVRYLEHVTRGFGVDDTKVSEASMAQVGPGGHYLGLKETRQGIRAGEHWQPDLLRRTSYADAQRGAPNEVDLAAEAVRELLSTHRPPPPPPGAMDRVAGILAAAEAGLPEA
jgi:trimethylamine---corrinoid protein Co-methyltransferase